MQARPTVPSFTSHATHNFIGAITMTQLKNKTFQLMLDQDDITRLMQLKVATGRSRAQLIREGITALHRMHIENVPTCASGMACYVPHMHPNMQKDARRHG